MSPKLCPSQGLVIQGSLRPSQQTKANVLEDSSVTAGIGAINKNSIKTVLCISMDDDVTIIMEDYFPNGRSPLEMAGVTFSTRDNLNTR